MSIYMKMRIEVDPYYLEEFLDALSTLVVPMNEERGCVLQASFVETLGPIKPVVVHDIWEIKDVQTAVTDWMNAPYANDPRWHEYSKRVKDIIFKEETVFMVKRLGRMTPFHSVVGRSDHNPGLFNEN